MKEAIEILEDAREMAVNAETEADCMLALWDGSKEALAALRNPWRGIEEAPRDGTIICLYREKEAIGSMHTLIYGAWHPHAATWVWPEWPVDVYDHHEWWDAVDEDCFMDNKFTLWQPLPPAPEQP